MPKYSAARMRAGEPHGVLDTRCEPQVLLTISMDKDLFDWVRGLSGNNSFFGCVEETIITALRCARAEEGGMNLDFLAQLIEMERRGAKRLKLERRRPAPDAHPDIDDPF